MNVYGPYSRSKRQGSYSPMQDRVYGPYLRARPDPYSSLYTFVHAVPNSTARTYVTVSGEIGPDSTHTHTHTHTRLTALCPGLPRWAGTRKVKSIWILLEQETVSGSGISWAICKSAPCSRQTTMPAPHQSVFYRPDALPAAQPTASKH